MRRPLYRLVYRSRLRLPGSPRDVAEGIAAVLAASRRNNPRVGVSGALLSDGAWFVQVLEGPRDGVEQVFARIRRDPRHTDVTTLVFAPVAVRTFASWSMAFVDRTGGDGDLARLTAESAFATLHRLVLAAEATAV